MAGLYGGAQVTSAQGEQSAATLAAKETGTGLGDLGWQCSRAGAQPQADDQDFDALAAPGSIDRVLHMGGQCYPGEEGQDDHAARPGPLGTRYNQ